MSKYLVVAMIILLAISLWLWQNNKIQKLNAELNETRIELNQNRAQLQQVEEANAVHRAYIKKLTEERQVSTKLLNDLRSLEGQDAPLSPLLKSTSDVLWK